MKVGLFIPCYIDQFYPQVGIATLRILEKQGLDVFFPENQTCCGQPMANSGFGNVNRKVDDLFVKNFIDCDYIVSPSGSCTLHIKDHLNSFRYNDEGIQIKNKTYELVEFLHDIIDFKVKNIQFPHKVGIHNSCHGLRGLRLASSVERNVPAFNKTESLLKQLSGIELINLRWATECCGFGGTFAVMEEDLSVKMGIDKLNDYVINEVKVVTSNDMSCLMHLEGLARRRNLDLKFLHVAEILIGGYQWATQ